MRRLLVLLLPLLFALPARGQTVTAPAGTYSITVPAPVVITYGAGSVTFTWGGPAPQPTPPVPPPTPPPAPPTPPPVPILTGEAWAMIVYEGTIPPVAISRAVRDYAGNLNINVDPVTTAEPRAAGYLAKAREVGLPAVVIVQARVDGAGEAKHAAKLPDEAGFIALMKQIRGKM